MSDRKAPWGHIQNDLSNIKELDEVLIKAGLDFYVDKSPVCFAPNGQEDDMDIDVIKVPDYFVTYRTDTNHPFGVVGSKYEIVQNHEAFRFIELLFEDEDIIYDNAGIFDKGSRMFVVVRIPGNIRIGEGDEIEKYLLFTTTHDGSGSITIAILGIRIWCSNMIQRAIRNAHSKFIIKHTKNAEKRIDYARQLLEAQKNYFAKLEEELLLLKSIEVTEQDIDNAIAKIFLPNSEYLIYQAENFDLYDNTILSTKRKNMLGEVRSAIDISLGQDTYVGTALWLYNGITSYIQHTKQYKDDDSRFTAVVDDPFGKKLDDYFDLLIETTTKNGNAE